MLAFGEVTKTAISSQVARNRAGMSLRSTAARSASACSRAAASRPDCSSCQARIWREKRWW